MKPDALPSIYKTRDILLANRTIPDSFLPSLRVRLPIYVKDFPRQKKSKPPRTNQQNKEYSLLKKAHDTYLEVWRIDPHILLPFIITVSPFAAATFNTSTFRQMHIERYAIHLGEDGNDTLDEMAQELDFILNLRYIDLINILRGKEMLTCDALFCG